MLPLLPPVPLWFWLYPPPFFFFAKIKLILNWESVSHTFRAANTGCAACGGGGQGWHSHHLQTENCCRGGLGICTCPAYITRAILHSTWHTHPLILVLTPFSRHPWTPAWV